MLYLWVKAFHIISMVAWFAGLFYIWRLFVYHAETGSSEVKETLAIMERRLYRAIMNPAMLATLFFGLWLIHIRKDAILNSGWLWVKLVLVTILLGIHHLANSYRKRLLAGIVYNSKRFRILNEIPTLILIATVILAILKPF
jgi:putative membrane protein